MTTLRFFDHIANNSMYTSGFFKVDIDNVSVNEELNIILSRENYSRNILMYHPKLDQFAILFSNADHRLEYAEKCNGMIIRDENTNAETERWKRYAKNRTRIRKILYTIPAIDSSEEWVRYKLDEVMPEECRYSESKKKSYLMQKFPQIKAMETLGAIVDVTGVSISIQ